MIRTGLVASVVLFLITAPGCRKPVEAPSGPAACSLPEKGQPMTSAQCECLRGQVTPPEADNPRHCVLGLMPVGAVGSEGDWCCRCCVTY